MIEYRLKLPLQRKSFDDHELTFSITHLRSRRPSIMYFILHLYGMDCQKSVDDETDEFLYSDEILVNDKPIYTSPRTVVGTAYGDEPSFIESFTIPTSYVMNNKTRDVLEDTIYYMVEIRTLGVDSENPMYFNKLMLQEGDINKYNGYHDPQEMTNSHSIELVDGGNMYANLYDLEGNYLQVIRPNRESFNTNNLNKADYTILAPHFEVEDDVDNHVSVFLEAMNQTEQRIDVLR